MARLFFLLITLLSLGAGLDAAEVHESPIAAEVYWRSGDDPAWARPNLDDGWQTLELGAFPTETWEGIGWFRFWVDLPLDAMNRPLALELADFFGAVDIYVDGALIKSIGQAAVNGRDEVARIDLDEPVLLMPPDSAPTAGGFELVIRYSAHLLNQSPWQSALPRCRPYINDYGERMTVLAAQARRIRIHQYLISAISAGFALVHLFFFLFYPKARGYADLALMTAALSVTVYTSFQEYFVNDPTEFLLLMRISGMAFALWGLECLRFQYVLNFRVMPRIPQLFGGIALFLMIYVWFQPLAANRLLLWFMSACIVFGAASFRKGEEEEKIEGLGIIGIGALPIMLLGTHQLLVGLGFLPELWSTLDFPGPYYAMLALMVSLSVVLARNFSRVYRDLEARLTQVQQLSDQNTKQEVERIMLVAEYARKTEELEASRRLQLSMLPKNIPSRPYLDLAVHMDTATEVGGDYYDFVETTDGALAAAVGDATGHGLRAGTVVASTKSLFRAHGMGPDPVEVLKTLSKSLHGVGFRKMFMALTLLHFRQSGFAIAAAGMPAALLYRASTGRVEEIAFKSMPLGTPVVFPYQSTALAAQPGDVVLVLSDGYLELFNGRREMLGPERTKAAFEEIAATGASAREVVRHMLDLGAHWLDDADQDDDVTLLVGRYQTPA